MKKLFAIAVPLATLVLFILGLVWWLGAPRQIVGQQVLERPSGTELRFFALGDTGSGNDNQRAVAAAMEKRCQLGRKPSGILMLGDNFYMDGVESLADPQWQSKIWQPYGAPCLGEVPIYAVLGNHDYKGKPGIQIDMTGKNPRWVMPARNYAVRFGDLLELDMLDSNFVDTCFSAAFCARDFFVSRVKAPRVRWRMALAHHPVISASGKYSDEVFANYRQKLAPLLCSSTDFYLSGHAHHLEHAKMAECNTHFLVLGGGGADLYPVVPAKTGSLFAKSAHGFADLSVKENEVATTVVGSDGSELYKTAVSK